MRGPVPGPPPTSCKVFKTLFSRAGHRVNFLRQCANKCRVPPQVLLLPVVMYFQHHLARLGIASIFRVNAPTNEEGRTQVLILRVVMYFKHYLAELDLVPIFRANAPMNGEGRPQVLILPVVKYFKHYLAELGLVPILCVIVPTNVGPPAIPERAKACTREKVRHCFCKHFCFCALTLVLNKIPVC